jgi:hypothetical protein
MNQITSDGDWVKRVCLSQLLLLPLKTQLQTISLRRAKWREGADSVDARRITITMTCRGWKSPVEND